METKVVAGLVAAALTLGFFAGGVVERGKVVREIQATKPDTVIYRDTVTIKLEKIVVKNLPGKLDTAFVFFDSPGEVTASIDTVLPPRWDSLSVSYHLPPVNAFDLSFRPASVGVERGREVITRTLVERSFFLGPYFRGSVRSPWFDGLMTLSKMQFDLGAGFSFQVNKFVIDLEPIDLKILDSKGDVGFAVNVRYYPWAN